VLPFPSAGAESRVWREFPDETSRQIHIMNKIRKPASAMAVLAVVLPILTSPLARADETGEKPEACNPSTQAPYMLENESELQKQLLDMIREQEGADLRLEGEIKCYGRWAWFHGEAYKKSGEPLNDGDVAALWLNTSYGWVLVDAYMDVTDAGHFDHWMKAFGVPRRIFLP
jgi:hypothetical protein